MEFKKRAAAYVRVSTASDAQAHSFEFQSDYWQNEIGSSADLELYRVYADKGISGRSMLKRPQFNTMIADALEGEIDIIFTKSVARFARKQANNLLHHYNERGRVSC